MKHIFDRRPRVPEHWWLKLLLIAWLLLAALAHVTEIYWDRAFEDGLHAGGEE